MKPLRLTTCMSEHTDSFCLRLAQHIETRLGIPTEFDAGLNWSKRMRLLQTGHIHMGWICGLPHVLNKHHASIRLELLAAPVMQGERYRGKAIYFADIMVSHGSAIRNFADLRGTRWAYNEKASFSGYLAVQFHLIGLGTNLDFFGSSCRSGTHRTSLLMLQRGEADCAAIDSTVFDMELLIDPGWQDEVKAVETLGPYPIPPWVISTRVPQGLRDELQAVLLEMHQDHSGQPTLQGSGLRRFQEPDDHGYEAIRVVYETVRGTLKADMGA